jgi:hypothetical protein
MGTAAVLLWFAEVSPSCDLMLGDSRSIFLLCK